MCDTILAVPDASAGSAMLFGKNSDRQRNEAQVVEYWPAMNHAPGSTATCTYIRIPQVPRTNAVLLSRPFWTWGAEMGANEHGVVIGNEGLQARSPPPREKALIGMDLLRLALERSRSAAEAVNVITGLLQSHGQGGNCGHLNTAYYNNGFMIADAHEAFVLETIEREWLVERVQGVRAISNQYSIGQGAVRTSGGLPALMASYGFASVDEPNYADIITDPQRAHIGSAGGRRARATALLESRRGQLTIADMIQILRDHTPQGLSEHEWDPRQVLPYSLCIHAGGEERYGQTTGAMVSEVRPVSAVHWVTATSSPCISIFKPVLLDVPLPDHGPQPNDKYDARTLWWRHELLHRRALLRDYKQLLADIGAERDSVERWAREQVGAVLVGGSTADRAHVVAECWRVAAQTEERWLARLPPPSDEGSSGPFAAFNSTWTRMSRIADLTI
jgi:hypothetical protein